MVVHCPAKVNLFLAVGPRDDIGYHPIRTIFQAVGLFDELRIEVADRDEITSNWDELPVDNTVSKTLRLLREFSDVPPLRMHLEKTIPAQAGLGGGSSDAAGLLRAVNRVALIPFRPEMLQEVARAVGADVPFFLIGGKAKGEGYGEKLTPLPDEIPQWMTIVKPEAVSCSTAEAYRRLDEKPLQFLDFPSEGDRFYNDFERVMPCESDDWMEHLQLLGAEQVLLCGSGSAVFGIFGNQAMAKAAAEEIKGRSQVQAWAVPTLSRHESLRIAD